MPDEATQDGKPDGPFLEHANERTPDLAEAETALEGTASEQCPQVPPLPWEQPLKKEVAVGDESSLTPSNATPQPKIVPRCKRRGLLGQVTLVSELENPEHYPRQTKWFITFLVALASIAAPLGSVIFFPSLGNVASSLHTSRTTGNLSVALYMLSMSIFPLWWSAFSETCGRRTVYLVSFLLFFVFSILSAVSVSILMLIPMRMLSGGAAASVQAIGSGTIADIWEVKERGRAMSISFLGPLLGPLLGPIIGGAIAQRWSWRGTQWFQVIFGGIVFFALLLGLPETLKRKPARVEPTIDGAATSQGSTSKATSSFQAFTNKTVEIFFGPLKIVTYLRFIPILMTIIWASVAFGSLYIMNISIEYTFSRAPYNFSELIVGLLYIPGSLGYILACIVSGKWMDYIMHREAVKAGRYDEEGHLVYQPEDRMRENAWLGTILIPAALIWYGWTAEKHVFWFAVVLSNFFFGVGSMILFSVSTTMLTELMPKQTSSGVALNNLVRNLLSCIGAIVGVPLINAVGNGWLFTTIALISLAIAASVTVAMRKYGTRWRNKMDASLS